MARVITLLPEKTQKKMCGVEKEGEEGRRRRKKVRRDESESETGSGVEGDTHGGRHSGTLSAARKEEEKGSM